MDRHRTKAALALAALVLTADAAAVAQQVVDTTFVPTLRAPRTFASGRGPVILIDEAHHNLHTASGRYRPFVRLVEADGFVVRSNSVAFDSATLAGAAVLVIANAVAEENRDQARWQLPVRSAFTAAEVKTVAAWVRRGGSLLLLADHMPFAGAADSLAAALGVSFMNGFAIPPFGPDPRTGDYPISFRRRDGLGSHPITNGRSRAEQIDSVVSFTGSAFRLGADVASGGWLLRLPSGTRVKLPVRAWQFSDSTPEIRGDGLLQGAAFALGRGRVVVFGEAALFSAQRKGADQVPMGFNAPEAADNMQFVLNTLHWLVRVPPM